LAALPHPDQVPPPPEVPTATPASAARPAALGWLATLNAKLAIEAGEVVYNKKPVRNVALELEARGGAVAVPKFTALLPG
jgi:hypothetical protein